MAQPRHVVLVEPYLGGSHRAWAEGFARHSTHDVHLLTHEAAFWRWRLRGGAFTLARELEDHVARNGAPDLLLVSDMVNVPALLGFARRAIGGIPVAVYFHENQLLYPPPPPRGRRPARRDTTDPEEAALVNWSSLAVADHVFVNTAFHRDALLDALQALLKRAPDHPHLDALPDVAARLSVLPVGVELGDLLTGERPDDDALDPPLVLWNQRWEHDKDPEAFFGALLTLAGDGVAFRLALAGENVRVDPREFDDACSRLGDRVVHVGYLAPAGYRSLLLRSDVVVSTAIHEFFGVAVVEAVAAGAIPLLPRRLSYPEIVPDRYHGAVLYGEGELTSRLAQVLGDLPRSRSAVAGLRGEMARFDWSVLAPVYDAELDGLV